MNNKLVVFSFLLMITPKISFADNNTENYFKVTPIAGDKVNVEDLAGGIAKLLPDATHQQKEQIAGEALAARLQVEELLQKNSSIDHKFNISSEKKMFLGSVVQREVSFDSLYQRAAQHKSNKVHGIYIGPNDARDCGFRYPTLLMVHHLDDDINPEILISKFMAINEIFGRGVGVMNIFLPHYGPRRHSQNEIFVNGNINEFKENVIQSTLDIHLMRDWLSQQSYVDPNRLTLFGISLGAMVNLVAAGMDPGFTGGISFMAGGGNIASMLELVRTIKPDDPLAIEFDKNGWNIEKSKYEMAAFDPIVWAYGLRKMRVQFIAVKGDKLIPFDTAIKPIVDQIASSGKTEVREIVVKTLSGGHRPDAASIGAKLKLAKSILLPLLKYTQQKNEYRDRSRCQGEVDGEL